MNINELKIAVVDDLDVVLDATSFFIKSQYPEAVIRSFLSPKKALDALRNENFDILLTDYDMPEMDGIQLALKFQDQSPWTRVAFITGLGKCMNLPPELKGTPILNKPFNIDELYNLIDSMKEE